jgi:hypothetical protein
MVHKEGVTVLPAQTYSKATLSVTISDAIHFPCTSSHGKNYITVETEWIPSDSRFDIV